MKKDKIFSEKYGVVCKHLVETELQKMPILYEQFLFIYMYLPILSTGHLASLIYPDLIGTVPALLSDVQPIRTELIFKYSQ